MISTNSIHLSSDSETEDATGKNVVKRPHSCLETVVRNCLNSRKKACQKFRRHPARYELEDEICTNLLSSAENNVCYTNQGSAQVAETRPCQLSSSWAAPICRQFWKAGNYGNEQRAKTTMKNGNSRMHIHPEFLHSNATSHKWIFAIAELLDNAVDEIHNGATFVMIDKTTNPRDGSPALLIQDDGGGMHPEAIRHCMSFGFSDKKKIKNAIGQYGNGFKTSSMRLGSDVIVFTRHSSARGLCQSIGLLSYTFLRQAGHDRIVVPLVDFEYEESIRSMVPVYFNGEEHFISNLSVLLQWSPYSTKDLLLEQVRFLRLLRFDDIGQHGTKIVIYNLWLNDTEDMELDFDSDAEDIRINADAEVIQTGLNPKPIQDQHITNLYRYSLRVYVSILYLRLPQSFKIVLRGKEIERHNLANDLIFPEFILYKPQIGSNSEAAVITTIGFLKDTRQVNVHGFSVYHWNRLILPFWPVVNYRTNNTARGIVGVLEANFIQPTHNKQDFEKTSLFQRLEHRLKEMTLEYWEIHCGLIGYQHKKKSRTRRLPLGSDNHVLLPVPMNPTTSVIYNSRGDRPNSSAVESTDDPNLNHVTVTYIQGKENNSKMVSKAEPRKYETSRSYEADSPDNEARQPTAELLGTSQLILAFTVQPSSDYDIQVQNEEENLREENRKLKSRLLDLMTREDALNIKAKELRDELAKLQQEYRRLLEESVSVFLDE
ncbi:protein MICRORCHIDIA 6-like isoform X2 [Daucus carota subsp. sativus]|uniref:protein MICRORCHIDIA 6-like isoform X2 n=1 Tax=Daucus carota subsp. sativus TaxID=79200 RepID=UPI0007EFF165|nr:PREDICTED: protein MICRORCHIDIA 6-like isoform X2 [Daucus carota subsp. sativus]